VGPPGSTERHVRCLLCVDREEPGLMGLQQVAVWGFGGGGGSSY